MKFLKRSSSSNERHQPLKDEGEEDRTESPSSKHIGGANDDTNNDDADIGYPNNPSPKLRTFSAANGADKDVEAPEQPEEEAYDDAPRQKAHRNHRWLLLISNLFFVLGSALYMVMAVDDLQWAKEARSIPTDVLYADDDATWIDYKTQEALEKARPTAAWTANATWIPTNSNGNGRRRQLFTYEEYAWIELPPEAQEAATTLGYDENSWDNALYVEEVDVFWADLNPEQQAAAAVLGYNQEIWDGDTNYTAAPTSDGAGTTTIPPPTNAPTPSPSKTTNNNNETPQQLTPLPIPELPFDGIGWDNLPEDALWAAQALGYNRNRWDNELPPRLVTDENPSWNDLNPTQQEAAQILGYSEETWWYIRRNYDNFTVPIEETTTTTSAPEEEEEEDVPEGTDGTVEATAMPMPDWELYDWAELPPQVQEAFGVLGYTGDMWDNSILAETESLGWEELTSEQQEAALFLGYNQAMWDGTPTQAPVETGDTATTTPPATPSPTIQWEQYGWDDLPPEIQLAYSVLGYTQQIWNEGGTTEIGEKEWSALNATQQAAAQKVGYTQEMWDGTPESDTTGTIPVSELPDAQWYDYAWSELPAEVQGAYEELGYDEQKWDNGELAYTEDLMWSQLSPAQQEAAGSLGYTQAIWDGAEAVAVSSETGEGEVSWDDDYVFLVKSRNVWVSRYQILYFAAAFAFVLVGMVDWCRERRFFHINMILAGLFGVVSAMLIEKDRFASTVCNSISVHFYLLEGLALIRHHLQSRRYHSNNGEDDDDDDDDVSLGSGLWWVPTLQITADVFFVLGAFMDVILSYFYFERSSDWNLALARVSGFSMLLWVACSSMYLLITLVVHFGWFASCTRNSEDYPRPTRIEVERASKRQKELKSMNFVAPLPETVSANSNSTT